MEGIPNILSKPFPPLQHFCCCISLNNGLRIISVLSLMFGLFFTLLANLLSEWLFADIIEIICQITGIIFYIWFLTLLLVQSLSLKIPRILTVWIAMALSIWLSFVFFFFIVSLIGQKTGHIDMHLFTITLLTCIGADAFAMYSVWVLKSYFYSLSQQVGRRSSIRSSSPARENNSNLEETMDDASYFSNMLLPMPSQDEDRRFSQSRQSVMRSHGSVRIAEILRQLEEAEKTSEVEESKQKSRKKLPSLLKTTVNHYFSPQPEKRLSKQQEQTSYPPKQFEERNSLIHESRRPVDSSTQPEGRDSFSPSAIKDKNSHSPMRVQEVVQSQKGVNMHSTRHVPTVKRGNTPHSRPPQSEAGSITKTLMPQGGNIPNSPLLKTETNEKTSTLTEQPRETLTQTRERQLPPTKVRFDPIIKIQPIENRLFGTPGVSRGHQAETPKTQRRSQTEDHFIYHYK